MAIRRVPATPELAARVRAARGYADISSQQKLADAMGVGKQTVVRIEAASMDAGVRVAWLRQIAEVTGVPYEFFTEPFAKLAEAADQPQLDRMEAKIDAFVACSDIDPEQFLAEMESRLSGGGGGRKQRPESG